MIAALGLPHQLTKSYKNDSDDLLNFCAIYDAQNADNAILFDDKLFEVYATNDSNSVRR